MSDLTPFGRAYSFAGTVLASLSNVADFSVVGVEPQDQIEAYAAILGNDLFVDQLNGANTPRKDVLTCQILVRASDATTDPVAAWQAVAAGFRALQGLPEQGTLVCYADTSATTTVSCQARRKRFSSAPTPSNARHYVVPLTFTLTTSWS